MRLASHNSLTYLPVKSRWMRPLAWLARCQRLTLTGQLRAGVRYFDVRVAFDGYRPEIAHGLMRYKGDVEAMLGELDARASALPGERVYVRLVLEDGRTWAFQSFCRRVVSRFRHLSVVGGYRKRGWVRMYAFADREPPCVDAYGSYHDEKPHRLWGLLPWLWARLNNRRVLAATGVGESRFVMMDFVGAIE